MASSDLRKILTLINSKILMVDLHWAIANVIATVADGMAT